MLLGRSFDEIDSETVRQLIESGASESLNLEFKREKYGNSDNDKKEFLKDITSFANSLGGHLLIGVKESNGTAIELCPLTGFSIDQELQRLENIIRTGIEPQILGLRMKRITVKGGEIIVAYIPRNHNPPHRVIFKRTNRYYSRHSSGVHEISMEALRRLFGEQRSIEDRARTFVQDRFCRILTGDTAVINFVSKSVVAMHLVPLPDFGADRQIEITTLKNLQNQIEPLMESQFKCRIDLDGVNFVDTIRTTTGFSYVKAFRNGTLEIATTDLIQSDGGKSTIASVGFPRAIVESVPTYIEGMRSVGVSPPILFAMSMSGMRGAEMVVEGYNLETDNCYQRETLHLPHSIVTAYRDDKNYESSIAEMMNYLWNAFGFERCQYFDKNGKWIDRK